MGGLFGMARLVDDGLRAAVLEARHLMPQRILARRHLGERRHERAEQEHEARQQPEQSGMG